MKRKFYIKIAFVLLLMMIVTSCKSQEKARVENNSNAKEVSQENVGEEKTADTKDSGLFVEKENPRIVAMSVKAAKALKFLGYENVVAVPNGAESIYPDASSIGDEMNPDFKLVKNLNPDYYLTDSSITYDKPLGLDYSSASFETLEDTKNGLNFFAKGLGLDEDATKEKIDSLTENI